LCQSTINNRLEGACNKFRQILSFYKQIYVHLAWALLGNIYYNFHVVVVNTHTRLLYYGRFYDARLLPFVPSGCSCSLGAAHSPPLILTPFYCSALSRQLFIVVQGIITSSNCSPDFSSRKVVIMRPRILSVFQQRVAVKMFPLFHEPCYSFFCSSSVAQFNIIKVN